MFPETTTDPSTLPDAVRQLLYLPTLGPGHRGPFCIICREDLLPDQPTAIHQCCGTTLCRKCFLSYILEKTWASKANIALAADCPCCKRPILQPLAYDQDAIIMVTTTIDLVRQCVGDYVFYSKPLDSRQQGDLLSDEQAMMMLDPEGKHPRAQLQYEEMKSHRAAGWRILCFNEANPSTFLVAEGWKTIEQCATEQPSIHPALRQQSTAVDQLEHVCITSNDGSELTNAIPAAANNSHPDPDVAKAEVCGRFKRLWHSVKGAPRVRER